MAIYVMNLSRDEKVNIVAGKWAAANRATPVDLGAHSARRRIENIDQGDTLVVVAHGSDNFIGASGNEFELNPTAFANALIQQGLKNKTHVVLAACSSDIFATALQTAIRKNQTHNLVTCAGQQGVFELTANFAP